MIYYFAGYRLVYFALTSTAKSEAASVMKNNASAPGKLVMDETTFNTLKWTNGNKEFLYMGQLYDIENITKASGKYTLEVYADKNETQWVKAFDNFVKLLFPSDFSKGAKNIESIISAFQKEYQPINKVCILPPATAHTTLYSYVLNIPSIFRYSDIWHPPAIC